MLVKPIFMLLRCPFNFGSDHPNAKVSVDVAVTGVPRGSDDHYGVKIFNEGRNCPSVPIFFICAVGLLVLRPLLAYCTSPG
jgi:hypothetical protein